jgi:hypothetical protein
MPIPHEYSREDHRIRLVRRAALVLGGPVLALAVIARFDPEWLRPIFPGAHQPVESAGLPAGVESAVSSAPRTLGPSRAPGPSADLAAQQVPDTARPANPPDSAIVAGDTDRPSRRRRPITDVVLLPCSMANPRPDGSFVIPPHNPRHRTIVGLPSTPGEPRRGLVIPPHDPAHENRMPIRLISMDSILQQSLQVAPHDPSMPNIVRPYAVPCLTDSTAQ